MPIHLGHSRGTGSVAVGRECGERAVFSLPPGSKPGWAIAFCGGRHEPGAILSGLREALGTVAIVGGAAVGTITRDGPGYSGFECAAAIFPDTLPVPEILAEGDLRAGEAEAGERLGARIREAAAPGAAVLMFYDSIHSSPPPRLHAGSQLLDGLYRGLNGTDVHIFGGGTVGDFDLSSSHVFDGIAVARHTAVAVVFPPEFSVTSHILHGCMPSGPFMEITAIEGAVVRELDGRPALDVLEDLLGSRITDENVGSLMLEVTLGQKHGDPFAPYDEAAYVNRLIVGADAAARTLTLFEPDFTVGTRVQFMTRDNDMMLASVHGGTAALFNRPHAAECLMALYVDCAGRARAFSGSESEEAETLLALCPPELPVFGFYSGVEIAPLMGRSRPLDWTGVLNLICLDPECPR